jgi:hypothetical protein
MQLFILLYISVECERSCVSKVPHRRIQFKENYNPLLCTFELIIPNNLVYMCHLHKGNMTPSTTA